MILSIDVGIKNLAMCLLDEIVKTSWSNGMFRVYHHNTPTVSMSHFEKHLDERPWVLDAKTVLIEKQPERNKKMVSVMHFLHAYFIIKCPEAETMLYDARHKIPDVAGPGKAQYNKRKKVSIERCEAFIRQDDVNAHWLDTFIKSKKKDDLADTVMQALSFVNRVEIKPVTKKKKITKLVARRPNENQKRTKYSKSNLAWIYLNDKKHMTTKRFEKDLNRYYKNLSELVKELK
jgi:hypothetical protein